MRGQLRKINPVDSIPHKLEEYIGALERHLLARDDGVEAQQQAKDLLYNWNYLRGDGGQAWHASGAEENGNGGNKDRPIAPPAVLDKQNHTKDKEDEQDEENNNENDTEKDKKNGGLLDKHKREELLRELHQLSFLSAPLAGLAAHLSTVQQGNHIKPNLRHGGTGEVVPIKEAERKDGGFETPQLRSIDIETDNTPFGKSMKASTTGEPLFKPATHGQFRLTRLDIIDKFGQAIHAIDPRLSRNPQKVWPCIGEWLAPQLRGDGTAREPNVVERDEGLTRKVPSHEDGGNGDDNMSTMLSGKD
ncbi:hypothetical protein VDGE_05643 [Verticillium dahliae]|uniref:Uncharacterized protein n=1 Tax=Verticillium dahliae TaxID=27337 RepID=A0A444S7E0_VERDA|nr:hypothetical protein VDGE_05643 [Verticillium dahliae]